MVGGGAFFSGAAKMPMSYTEPKFTRTTYAYNDVKLRQRLVAGALKANGYYAKEEARD